MARERSSGNATGFTLDPNVAVSPDGATLGGFPGVWKPGVVYHPDALGMTVADMRDKIEALGLPLVETKARESSMETEFELPSNHLASEPNVAHPLAAGPGFGDPDSVAAVDQTALDHRAAVLEGVAQGKTVAEADAEATQEEAE